MKLYGVLDVAFATLYAWFGFVFTPGRSTTFNLALALVCLLLGAAGIGLVAGVRWARALATVACWALIAFTAVVVALLVVSSAYLRGIYGPLGQGMAVMTLLVAALVVEGFTILPLLQLRALRRG